MDTLKFVADALANDKHINENFRASVVRRPIMVTCIYCKEKFDANDEGVTYANGEHAHEGCHDGNEFNKANASDFRD
jgi:hypothetical protein